MKKRVVVIGGNAAGMSAASQVKRQKPEWEAVVLEKGEYISYAACGMPYYLEGIIPELEQLMELSPENAVNERNIDLRLNHEVTKIAPREKQVEVKSPQGPVLLDFDYLVIATGALPLEGGIESSQSGRIFTLKSLSDSSKIKNFLESSRPQKCAVIGGGYIAVEMLEAFKVRGLQTHLIHRRNDLARTFEKEISSLIKEKIVNEGIVMHLNTPVSAVQEKDGQAVVITADGQELNFDFVLVATGVRPNTALLAGTGIELGIKEAVRVNEHLQTNFDYIYSAGDCTETKNIITGGPTYTPLALKANKEGFIAGLNICGKKEVFPGIVQTAITKFFNLGIARTGLSMEEAEKNALNPVKYTLSSRSRARYYPGSEMLHSVVIISKNDGRLLGAQLAGPLDSVKRIDVYAAAITAGMTVGDLFNLDLAYAPPFSPVYDPVILAARVGRKYV